MYRFLKLSSLRTMMLVLNPDQPKCEETKSYAENPKWKKPFEISLVICVSLQEYVWFVYHKVWLEYRQLL